MLAAPQHCPAETGNLRPSGHGKPARAEIPKDARHRRSISPPLPACMGRNASPPTAKLLHDPDLRIQLGAVNALLDRGFGKPVQAVTATDDASSLTIMHLTAMSAFSNELTAERLAAENGQTTIDAKAETSSGGIDLMAPALE
jgi:hypothetical protein